MKLTAFDIQNYRSIIHTGWRNLSHDNITALIGQNESGKTSVLGALYSFYEGSITEDVLRSDLSLPAVSCRFELQRKTLIDFFDSQCLDEELKTILSGSTHGILTRAWNSDRSSRLYLANEEVLTFFERKQVERAAIEEKTQNEINQLFVLAEQLFREMEQAEELRRMAQQQLNLAGKELLQARRTLKRSKKPDERILAEKAVQNWEQEYTKAEADFTIQVDRFDKSKQRTEELSGRISVCKASNEARQELEESVKVLQAHNQLIKELDHLWQMASNPKEQKSWYQKLQVAKSELEALEQHQAACREADSFQKMLAWQVLDGRAYSEAVEWVTLQQELAKKYYSVYDLGQLLMEYIPVFEFFEDFSSLLPNRIDLEDILNENSHTEGYKAARNFLLVAGLNADFFREKNQRILKQKIENLNSEITINFQDYWSQNVGKDSKICLNFELEHYDYTHPEKSGKPYIEFWIKDKHERLYPKQRSRGVRWFLSFYLELKATAKASMVSRVMLIDEPGLSLHARAQEDVLKVFEDLKDSMQLIYCTHSPHLIDTNRLYRILAVQRAHEEDDTSETLVLESNALYAASTDTLSPIYALMGVKVNNQDFIKAQDNILVEDTLSYYYLNVFCKLAGSNRIPAFIPATGLTNLPVLANIMLGWKVDFSILFFGEYRSDKTLKQLAESFFFANEEEMKRRVIQIKQFEYPEDVFSTLDFKKFVLQKREGITQSNSEYVLEQGLSRTILASQFINFCETRRVQLEDFDDSTRENIRILLTSLTK